LTGRPRIRHAGIRLAPEAGAGQPASDGLTDELVKVKSAVRQRPSGKHEASAGAKLRAALRAERPLQMAGVIHAYAAILAERAGFRALYLSGAGVANASYGVPDIGLTALDDVLIDVRRITSATQLPLLVDADTGWNNPARTVREMIREGAAGIHLEDQVEAKRCGHLAGKQLVKPAQMVARIQAAIAGRTDPQFVIMARTDAAAVEGLDAAIARAKLYRDAGADMIFAEALTTLDEYRKFTAAVKIPVLANITEFGKTPLFTTGQLNTTGVRLVLYPLSAFRAMNAAAQKVYRTVRQQGTQRKMISHMQTRAELYELLGYDALRKGNGK
jgi:methylisocitrate lyase